jgi:hypothetical protein
MDSYWETSSRHESEWTKEVIIIRRRLLGGYEIESRDNTEYYGWRGQGVFTGNFLFQIQWRSTVRGSNSFGAGMFIRNTQGHYLAGHWYGFTSENLLRSGKWMIVRQGINPISVANRLYDRQAIDALERSAESGFRGPLQRKVFINYRRTDSLPTAMALQRALSQEIGESNVFVDLRRIAAGDNHLELIDEQIGICDTMLVLMGPTWASSVDESGDRRLFQDNDMVRLEIRAAVVRNDVVCIPVLIDGTQFPQKSDVPQDIEALLHCQAINFRNTHFTDDIEQIYQTVRRPRSRREPRSKKPT